ncbi:MAG TPA: GtrA family protein [Xanthobacteraceae bacterium]|jgi:putative flippase GtrA|nr:GtrA family protein [Xanthobacteraceae bacterium]
MNAGHNNVKTVQRIVGLFDRAFIVQASRFAAIGVVNTAVDFGVFWLAINHLTSSLIFANIVSWTVAVSGSYILNSFITFAAESGQTLRLRDYGTFIVAGVAGLIANTATLLICAKLLLLHVLIAKVFAIGVSFLVNFSLARFVVFRPRHSRAGAPQ